MLASALYALIAATILIPFGGIAATKVRKHGSLVSEESSIGILVERCKAMLAATHNVHCVKGLDTSAGTNFFRPSEDLQNDAAVAALFRAANKQRSGYVKDDFETMSALALMGVVGDAGESTSRHIHNHYAFLYIYRARRQDAPITVAELFVYETGSDFVGVRGSSNYDVVDKILGVVEGIGLFGPQSQAYEGILTAATRRAEAAGEIQRKEASKQKAVSQPRCSNIVVNGYAAVSPEVLNALVRSGAPQGFAARRPLVCEDKSWGGHIVNGGVINRSHQSVCGGVVSLVSQSAEITDWDEKTFRINTEVFMNDGPRTLALFIRRSSASCGPR